MELRYSPYQRKKSSRKTATTASRPYDEGLNWTLEEDSLLRDGVCQYGGKKWRAISENIKRWSPEECCKRWNKLQSLGSVLKRPWSEDEDQLMIQLVEKYGASKWAVIASYLKGRNGKQCRERWHNQLNPSIKKTPWTDEENAIILSMQAQLGNCWAKITSQLPGRTDNAVKNHWHSSLKAQAKARNADLSSDDGIKSGKLKKRTRKTKPTRTKKSIDLFMSPLHISDQEDTSTSTASIEDISLDFDASLAPFDDLEITSPDSVVDLFAPIIDCASIASTGIPFSELQSGSLSPDTVTGVENLDMYTFNQSYHDGVMRAQAVIENILDPMGMGGGFNTVGLPGSCGNESSLNHSFQQAMAIWGASDEELYTSVSKELRADDPTVVEPTFGLEELFTDSLQGMGKEGLQGQTIERDLTSVTPIGAEWAYSCPSSKDGLIGNAATPVAASESDDLFNLKDDVLDVIVHSNEENMLTPELSSLAVLDVEI